LLPRSGEKINADKLVQKELKSIVVLPVQNLTGDPENEYVAEVFHTLITDELYRLGFLVRPTHSKLNFSDSLISDPVKSKELKIDTYLKPTLLCSGDSYCVSVQLYQSIPEEKLLWSQNFQQGKNQVYDIFRNSALNIAEQINFKLTKQQKDYLSTTKTIDPAFFDTLMVGKHFIQKSNPEDFELGVRKLLKANDLNPLDPAPLLALAVGYSNSGHSSSAGVDATKLSVAYAQKALKLDSTLIDAYVILATFYLYQDWDFEKAENALNRCIEVNDNIAPARYHKGWFFALTGEFDKAADEMKKAMEIDPLDPIIPGYLGWLYQYAEEYEKAIDAAKLTLAVDPNYVMAYYVWGTALSGLGKHDEAIEMHKKGVAIKPGFMCGLGMAYAAAGQRDKALEVAAKLEKKTTGWSAWGLSLIYAQLGDKEKTLFWIESMVEKRQDFVPWISQDPYYNFIYKDKRFQEIVDRLNLPKKNNLLSKK
jgi:tetratricopeptide (TPR) repeat protein